MNTQRILLISFALLLSIFSAMAVSASPGLGNNNSAVIKMEKRAGLTCGSLESVVDDLVEVEMTNAQIPGVVVAIVQDGQVRLEKGYGWADVAAQIPVSPEDSIFQAGSVSKLFTWTAVMQLTEQGKLDLDADVNQYLDEALQIAPAFDQPVTLADLMHHSAGFEDRMTGIYMRDAAALGTLSGFLASNQPERVRPPGEIISYSNYGTALAAYIVQRVSGQPFDQYVADHIFQPLEMNTASFQQPVAAAMSGKLVTGYGLGNDGLAAQPVTYTRQVGAGGLTATARDMSHFMLAYLGDGRYNAAQMLEPSTVGLMMNRRFTHHPQLAGNVSGFWETADRQVLYHTGDTLSFSSMLALLPEENMGVFIAYNRVTDAPRWHILNDILAQCLDAGMHPQAVSAFTHSSGESFTGVYRSVRIDTTTPAKLLAFGWETTVRAASGSQLEIDGKQYQPIAPDLFQQVDGPERVAVRLDEQGDATHLFFDSVPTMAFEKLRWWETSTVQIAALTGPLLIFLATLVGWGVRRSRNKQPSMGAAHWIAAGMSLVGIVTAGLAGAAMMGAADIVFGMPLTLQFSVWLGSLFVALAAFTLGFSLRLWIRNRWMPLQRWHYTLLALSGLVFVWFLSYWNLAPDLNKFIEWLTI